MSDVDHLIYYKYLRGCEPYRKYNSAAVNSVPNIRSLNPWGTTEVAFTDGNVDNEVDLEDDTDDIIEESAAPLRSIVSKGEAFTNQGPAPYGGDILEDPDLVWTEDVWDDEREEEAQSKLAEQGNSISGFWKEQYENKAGSYWHKFYKRNADHFYKDRHYLHIVFPELLQGTVQYQQQLQSNGHTIAAVATNDVTNSSDVNQRSQPHTPVLLNLLEVGCGVGNAVLPLIELNPCLHVVAMDFAKSAIDILNKHPFAHSCVDNETVSVEAAHARYLQEATNKIMNSISNESSEYTSNIARSGGSSSTCTTTTMANTDVNTNNRRVRTAVRCIVKDALPVPAQSMDLTLCMFVLSAISPEHQLLALRKISDALRVGGKVLIRDYGR